jgi:hypothetical protein
MNAKISRRKILSTLNVFEASGLAFQAPKRAKPLPGLGNELEFRATQLGIEVAEKLRFEGATS